MGVQPIFLVIMKNYDYVLNFNYILGLFSLCLFHYNFQLLVGLSQKYNKNIVFIIIVIVIP